jgi:predicted nucleic acid-binding protein
MRLLADCEFLTRLEKECRRKSIGPAIALAKANQLFVNTVSQAEFLSGNPSEQRAIVLALARRLPMITYEEANLAGALRCKQRLKGKTLNTPDALMAVSAMRHKCRLVTTDKDYSGIPGLDWSSYRS